MPVDPVEAIARAVLYEGYILYPYRASAVKNRQRFNFGALYPPAHSRSQTGNDTDRFQIECLIVAPDQADPCVSLRFRCLHLQSREIFRLESAGTLEGAGPREAYALVPALEVDDCLHQTWQEAVERQITVDDLPLAQLVRQPVERGFTVPGSRHVEPLCNAARAEVGRIVRRQQQIDGRATITAERLAEDLYKLRIVLQNTTLVADAVLADRDELLLGTCISTHAILRVAGGQFVSLLEPPDRYHSAVAACRNVGLWPVLVGEPGRCDQMLASPIILYDYPQVAPESSGDWCDGAEIDEMLALRVMTLTGEEKRAMRDVDARAREILERTESLGPDALEKLHGTLRSLRRCDHPTPAKS